MGTTRSGRYLNTKGAGMCVNDSAFVCLDSNDFGRDEQCVNNMFPKDMQIINGVYSRKASNHKQKKDRPYRSKIAVEIRETIRKRILADNGVNDVERCKKEEIAILLRNIAETISFLETECTAVEFLWLSEVFIDIVKRTQSRGLLECLYRTTKKFAFEYNDKCYIFTILRCAEAALTKI